MPKMPPKACGHPGCGDYATKGGRCDEHQRKAWEKAPGRNRSGEYGYAWQKLRLWVLRRDRYLCQECLRNGRVTPATEVDHIKPKFEGGTDEACNTQGICRLCHKVKTQREALRARGKN